MVRLTIMAFFSGLVNLVAVAPSAISHQGQTSLPEPGEAYHLRTRVTSTRGNASAYNDLYVAAFHTGAASNDVVLVKDVSLAAKGFLNNTNQEFDLGSSFPYGLTKSLISRFYVAW